MQDIQTEYNYLPREALEKLSKKMDIPQSQVYSMATFFRAFSLKKRGKHIVNVCLGTACHVRGAELIVESLERQLGVKARPDDAGPEFHAGKRELHGLLRHRPGGKNRGRVFRAHDQ